MDTADRQRNFMNLNDVANKLALDNAALLSRAERAEAAAKQTFTINEHLIAERDSLRSELATVKGERDAMKVALIRIETGCSSPLSIARAALALVGPAGEKEKGR